MIKKINTKNLKNLFVRQLEENILSGYFRPGEKLPPERELALQTGVSRPVVHEGLVELAAKGFVTIKPRHGTVVNDYIKEGSLGLMKSMFQFGDAKTGEGLLAGLLEMRILFEVENARLAALNRTDEQLKDLYGIMEKEMKIDPENTAAVTTIDFDFHHWIALATGNLVYPLMLNSMKSVYMSLAGVFFSDPSVIPVVMAFHKKIADAVEQQDEIKTMQIMKDMLLHGESKFRSRLDEFISSGKGGTE